MQRRYHDFCTNCLARNNGFCEPLDEQERTLHERHLAHEKRLRRGDHVYHEGSSVQQLHSLASGWVLLYHQMRDGRRQGLDLLLPGAFFGLLVDRNDSATHSAICLTDCEVCSYSQDAVVKLMKQEPEIAIRALRLCSADRVRLYDLVVNIGRRSAIDRVIRFLCQLMVRLNSIDRSTALDWLPIGQQDLSDLLGLTSVHMSRVLGRLKALGIVQTKRGRLKITDAGQLARLAEKGESELPIVQV